MSPEADQRRRRRSWVIRGVVIAAVVGLAVVVFRACAPMTVASWSAVSAAEALVGDRGEVDAYIVEPNINVMPRCEVRLQMRENVTADELVEVLSGIDGTDTGSTCSIVSVRTEHPTSLEADDWSGVSDEGWALLADRMLRSEWVSIYRADEQSDAARDWKIVGVKLDGDTAQGAAGIREIISGGPLEPELGRTEWDVHWNPSRADPVPHEMGIISDVTPPIAVADMFDDLVPIIERISADTAAHQQDGVADIGDAVYNVQVWVNIAGDSTRVSIAMPVRDWGNDDMIEHEAEFLADSRAAGYAADLIAAVRGSALEVDAVTVIGSDYLVWGDARE
ncbi:hypothetical protein [Microbacterium sp. H1-D42]|uniref:hypothetical protein n=1 Tax=Microbacterium sp. H1-D42 TaxID=2925844 RepID=UPI001F5362AF|nr:hypothetical protein [Microbacterium sp. H1-D42]UNK71401.1 hypothetical protein MNR00_02795 [Microbacterium sp. H1-D42]